MFEGLNLIIPLLAMLAAGCVGLVFVVAGWVRFAADAAAPFGKGAPKPLVAFTAAVCFDFVLYPVLSLLDSTVLSQGYVLGDIEVPQFAFGIGFVLSAILNLVALVLALRNANSTSRVVRWGSMISLSMEGVGVLLFAIARYST